MPARKPSPNLGGARAGAGRPAKLIKPTRLSVNVEETLVARLDAHRKATKIPNKTGDGSRDTPRGDVVTSALELYLSSAAEGGNG